MLKQGLSLSKKHFNSYIEKALTNVLTELTTVRFPQNTNDGFRKNLNRLIDEKLRTQENK